MKVNTLETHDRLLQFKKNSSDIAECYQDILNKKPFGDRPFYVFVHARTDDNGTDKRLIWQPRLTKPTAQTNSILIKAYPNSEKIKVLWILPPREMWDEYIKGKMFEHPIVVSSIYDFENNRKTLESPEDDDPSDEEAKAIYRDMIKEKP
jgi:hypothetical protein